MGPLQLTPGWAGESMQVHLPNTLALPTLQLTPGWAGESMAAFASARSSGLALQLTPGWAGESIPTPAPGLRGTPAAFS